MPTAAERDQVAADLAEARNWVLAVPVDELPPPPPPPPGNKVVYAAAVPGERSLDVTWTSPASATAILVSWGDESGYLSSSGLLLPSAGSWHVANLRPVPHTVEIQTSVTADLTIDPTSKVTLRHLVPLPGTGGPTGWPAAGSWDDKRDWVLSVAGAPDEGLELVGSTADLARLSLPGSWNAAGRFWDLPAGLTAATYDGLDVRGEIFVRGLLPHLHSVKCQGVRFARDNNANNGRTIRLSECGFSKHPTFPVGNGSLNTWGRPTLEVTACDFSGHADGIQHAGDLSVVESYFHDQIYNQTSHNDWCQGYGGSYESFERCYMYAEPTFANHQNGLIFTDNPSPRGADVVDCMLVVRGPHRATSWAANAYMGGYRFLGCLIDGKIVGRQPVTRTECDYRP